MYAISKNAYAGEPNETEPTTFICYLDAKHLYMYALSTRITRSPRLPIGSEKVSVTKKMLFSYVKSLSTQHILTEKRVTNLADKKRYVTHYVDLKL